MKYDILQPIFKIKIFSYKLQNAFRSHDRLATALENEVDNPSMTKAWNLGNCQNALILLSQIPTLFFAKITH